MDKLNTTKPELEPLPVTGEVSGPIYDLLFC